MQPYFFPYAQQIRHIGQCDRWIVFDTPQFTRKSWITRNRIADRNREWSYISAPVRKGASHGNIVDATLAPGDWRRALRDRLRVYEGVAGYYEQTMSMVERCIDVAAQSIADLNTHILTELCNTLAIGTPIDRLSALDLALPEAAEPGEWALLISKAFGASTYSNASGGRHLFDSDHYRRCGIELEFYEPIPLVYQTAPGFTFVPDLSVVDALMWQGRSALAAWCRR